MRMKGLAVIAVIVLALAGTAIASTEADPAGNGTTVQQTERFTDNGNGTKTDNITGVVYATDKDMSQAELERAVREAHENNKGGK